MDTGEPQSWSSRLAVPGVCSSRCVLEGVRALPRIGTGTVATDLLARRVVLVLSRDALSSLRV